MTFTANVRYDHVTMFILYLPLVVFRFSDRSSSFALASKAGIGHFRVAVNLYESEAKCKTFHMKISLVCI